MNSLFFIFLLVASSVYGSELSFVDACNSNQAAQVASQLKEGFLAAIRSNAIEVFNLLLPAMEKSFLSDPTLMKLAISSGSEDIIKGLMKVTPDLSLEVGFELAELAATQDYSPRLVHDLCFIAYSAAQFGRRPWGMQASDQEALLQIAAKNGRARLLRVLGEHWKPFEPDVENILQGGADYDELSGKLVRHRSIYSNRQGEIDVTPGFVIHCIIDSVICTGQKGSALTLLTPAFTQHLSPIQLLFQYSRVLAFLQEAGYSMEYTQLAMCALNEIDAGALQSCLQRPELAEIASVYWAREVYFYLYVNYRRVLPKEIRQRIASNSMIH